MNSWQIILFFTLSLFHFFAGFFKLLQKNHTLFMKTLDKAQSKKHFRPMQILNDEWLNKYMVCIDSEQSK